MSSKDLFSIHGNVVLIGYPSNFHEKVFFLEKVSSLLDNLSDFLIISVDDTKGFIENNFPLHVVERISSKDITYKEVSNILRKTTHRIIFWDGEELTKFVHQILLSNTPHKIIPVKTTKVVNRDCGDAFDVYIGRRGPWGNPFIIGKDGERNDVIEKYKKYFYETLINDPSRKDAIMELKGLRLGCHCKPHACHGDVIAEYLNKIETKLGP